MNTTEPKFYEKPTIIEVEDVGDWDARLWTVTASYRGFEVTRTNRDRSAAERAALAAVQLATPETNYDFAEVE